MRRSRSWKLSKSLTMWNLSRRFTPAILAELLEEIGFEWYPLHVFVSFLRSERPHYLEDGEELVALGLALEDGLECEHLCEDAASCPHIDGRGVSCDA
jgi:hypothetical protein